MVCIFNRRKWSLNGDGASSKSPLRAARAEGAWPNCTPCGGGGGCERGLNAFHVVAEVTNSGNHLLPSLRPSILLVVVATAVLFGQTMQLAEYVLCIWDRRWYYCGVVGSVGIGGCELGLGVGMGVWGKRW